MASPRIKYDELVAEGLITTDPVQITAIGALETLGNVLDEYSAQMGKQGWAARLGFGAQKRQPPKGLYIWGGVGRGKSMIMDLFYEQSDIQQKQRVHFHAFMQEVHKRLHAFRKAQKAGKVAGNKDGVEALARVISDRAWLICFDEFHVTDIADAMILGALFTHLFDQGVVVVATSNRHPNDLYKDGLQRERFLPFIDVLIDKMNVMELTSARDYRLERLQGMEVYITPSGEAASAKLAADFDSLTVGVKGREVKVDVNGRTVTISNAAEGVALVLFEELCAQPLGPGDYLEIATRFHTMMIQDIPKLGPHNRNEAKRFVTLIDALYEAKVNLVCSAAVPPTELYIEGDGAFEFERTVSRLMEMQAADYMALPHQG